MQHAQATDRAVNPRVPSKGPVPLSTTPEAVIATMIAGHGRDAFHKHARRRTSAGMSSFDNHHTVPRSVFDAGDLTPVAPQKAPTKDSPTPNARVVPPNPRDITPPPTRRGLRSLSGDSDPSASLESSPNQKLSTRNKTATLGDESGEDSEIGEPPHQELLDM